MTDPLARSNLVWEKTTTAGTGPYTTVTIGRGFANAFGTGGTNVFAVFMVNTDVLGEWMYATAHMSASNTLVIDTVVSGSNGASAVNFSAGTKHCTNDVASAAQMAWSNQATTAPVTPQDGDIWLDPTSGVEYQRVTLATTTSWAELGSAGSWGSVNVTNLSPTNSIVNLGNTPMNITMLTSITGSALNITLAGNDGNALSPTNPGWISYSNATETTATQTITQLTASPSITISSGATLGQTTATALRTWVLAINSSVGNVLGVINCCSSNQIFAIKEWGLTNATSMSSVSNTAGTVYSSVALSSDAYRILGFLEWSSAGMTAGTWSTTNLLRNDMLSPGSHLPGQPVQTLYNGPNVRNDNTASTSYVVTSDVFQITPTSAANAIKVTCAGGSLFANQATANAGMRISRSSVANTNMIGGECEAFNDGVSCPAGVAAFDKPNTTSSVAYAFQLKTSINTSTASWGLNVWNSAMVIEELMG